MAARLLTLPFNLSNGFGIIRTMATPLTHKVRLKLSAEDLANVRFAFSPLWECVAAFRAWLDPSRHALLLPWMTRVRTRLDGVDWEPVVSLASVSRGTIPDFLSPPPSTPLPRFSEELASLRRTPDHVVRAEMAIAFPRGVPRSLRSAVEDPKGFLLKVATLLEEFWNRALAPDWPLLRSKLEAEVLFRSRALALGGADALFKGIHRDIRYEHGCLTIRTDSYWDGEKRKSGILLVPSIFSWPDVFLTVRPPWRPTIAYTSRGVAQVWSDEGHRTSNGAHQLLGRTCARIITVLKSPQTTIETATALRLSSPAASEQITKLWRAGILERTRIGRRVFYALNPKGRALLAALEP